MNENKKKALGSVFSALINLFIFMIFALILYVVVLSKTGDVFGYKIYVVSTSSMTPTLDPGELIIVKQVPFEELSEDDIITFISTDKNILGRENTHRIFKIENDVIFTKGDIEGSEVDEATVNYSNVIGKLVHNSKTLGRIVVFITNPINMIFYIMLPLGLIILFNSKNIPSKLIRLIKDIKNEKAMLKGETEMQNAELQETDLLESEIKKTDEAVNSETIETVNEINKIDENNGDIKNGEDVKPDNKEDS